MSDSRRASGQDGEVLALAHLQRQGLRLIARNWSCRAGELDLVMLEGDTVVFVEVRYRRHDAWGGALESIDARKRQKLIRAAQFFLLREQRWASHPSRFDVVALGASPDLNWIRNAFDG
ncbi:YraN family protein [Stutzerimonas tarimensis]|uniref:UPF0102 protein ACFOMF_05245 n=1 Tax=Stutzerimonas tarimensis TaxID=1507735 RepID=A0ABV7T291_9GAMM